MKFQQHRGSKSHSSSHRGGGQERRERRREEIRSQLYPTTTAEDQRGEPHLLYRRHHRTGGIESNKPVYAGNGDHFHGYQNGFLEEPMNSRAPHPASFSQGTAPFHDMPASYTEQFKPLAVHSQSQEQPLLQPTKPASSSAVEASEVTKTTEAKDNDAAAAEFKRDPPALQEKTDGAKLIEDSSVSHKKEVLSKPHPQASVEKPLQERKEEVMEIEKKDEKGEHTGPLNEEPTKPHPPIIKTEMSIEPTPSLPSKSDLNSEVESLASVIPSSEQISDPFALPSSSSLPKLPPLKKSLPPLLPPIGATAAASQSAKKTEQQETKLLESAAMSNERKEKGDKEGSDKDGDNSSVSVDATHRGDVEGGSDSKREVKVENEGSDKEVDSSSANVAATRVGIEGGETPDIGKGSSREQVHDNAGQQAVDSTDQKGGGESSGGTTENPEHEAKDSSSTATKISAVGSDKHTDKQQKQVESQKSPQSEASPVKKEKVNDGEEMKDERQTDHLGKGSGENDGGEGEKSGGKGGEGKAAEGERKEKATVCPPMSVVTPPPKQPRNLKVR